MGGAVATQCDAGPPRVLTRDDRHRVLVEWNRTERTWPTSETLHALIERQVDRTPDAPAVIVDGATLTYTELNARANQLARYLQRRGVGPGVLVGLAVERSIEMVVGLLGVLKAGGAYVPLDPDYPASRLAFMVEDAGAPVLLTQARLVGVLPAHGAEILCLDTGWADVARETALAPESPAGPADPAYMIYTSGSTGRPKGALNSHRGIVNRLKWMQERYALTADDVVLQKTPFSFDVSVWEFFWPLLAGARLLVARPRGHQDARYLADTIAAGDVTVLHFVPSMLRTFLDEPGLARCTRLRHVISSGEALTADLQQRFFARLSCELHNLYGPTEAAVDVTHWTCRRDDSSPVVPIGRPVANTQIYILDASLEPLPPGEAGELYVGGVQVGLGYHNRPDLTAERFIPDPFSATSGARLYKTGDLARFLPDGNVEFLGRLDFQVKVRGFRIELGEIESALGEHPAIRQAVVLAVDEGGGDRRLIACLEGCTTTKPTTTALRETLGGRLPDYMVPSAFVWVDRMPLLPNGKVDRQALPATLPRTRPDLAQAYVAPRTELERFIAAEWEAVLGLDQVGIEDRFFELGGTSLMAAEFVNRMQRELDAFMYVVALFSAPTVASFAALLQRDYRDAVGRRFLTETDRPAAAAPDGRVSPEQVARLRSLIPVVGPRAVSDDPPGRNPRAMFVLAPPRSGTTLLRVMLAGHPGLFAAAELQLLNFESLADRRAAFTGRHAVWLEGLLRAVMELQRVGPDEARQLVDDLERRGLTTKGCYREIQQWIHPRMLVDKSPQYALDAACLQKAERDFDAPLYIHLTRHPYAMVRSFESYHMDQVLFLDDHPFTARELGELVWTASHETTLTFLASIPAARQFHMTFEDLTRAPEPVVRRLCDHVALPFHPDLLSPYKDVDRKMVDGLYASSTPMGDTHFRAHQTIDARVADKWQGLQEDDCLGDVTWAVAERLGYARPAATGGDWRRSRLERQRAARRQHRDTSGAPRG